MARETLSDRQNSTGSLPGVAEHPWHKFLVSPKLVVPAFAPPSQVSDMRHHNFAGRYMQARLLYLRASTRGACDYVDDSRCVMCVCVLEIQEGHLIHVSQSKT